MANEFDEFDTPAKAEADPFAEFDKPEVPKEEKKSTSFIGKMGGLMGRAAGGIAEAGLSMATGAVASAAGGLYGATSLLSGEGTEEAARKVRETQEQYTYQPRTKMGEAATRAAGAPMEMASAGLGKVGGAIGDVLAGEQGRIAGESLGEVAPQLAMAAAPLKAVQRAGVKPIAREPVPVAGETYSPLREMTPEQQQRYARQKEQGIQPTVGSVTRAPEQVRFEEQAAKQTSTEAGRAMYEREKSNQQAIMNAIKKTDEDITKRDKLQPTAIGELQTGESVSGALHKMENQDWSDVKAKYDKAKASGETNLVINANPLKEWLNKNRSLEGTTPAIKAIRNEVTRLEKEFNGNLTLGDMEELYKTASNLTEQGKSSSVYMPQVKKVINEMTQGQGGDLYREARQARRNYGKKWEDQKVLADLVGTKFGYPADPKVASERIFERSMLSKSTSLKDLQNLGETLLGGDLKQFPEGPQAMRELQSHTITHLLEKSKAGTSEAPRLSHAAFTREVARIGKDKLDYLLGKDSVKQLEDTMKSMEETQVQPGKVSGSPTYLNQIMDENIRSTKDKVLEAAADHFLSALPWYARIPAKVGVGVSKASKKALEEQKTAQAKKQAFASAAEEALTPRRASLADIKEQAAKERAINEQMRLEEALPRKTARKRALKQTALAGALAGQQEQERQ